MEVLKGIPVSRGFGIAQSLCLDIKFKISDRKIHKDEVNSEIERLEKVIAETLAEIDFLLKDFKAASSEHEILSTHKTILKDPELQNNLKNILSRELVTLEKALELNLQSIRQIFSQMDDDYFSARIVDYQDVTNRMMRNLDLANDIQVSYENKILIAQEITPSQVMEAYKQKAVALVSLQGSKKSHTSILARSLMLPYVANIATSIQDLCSQKIIVDGFQGLVITSPDAATIDQYQEKLKAHKQKYLELIKLADVKARTRDGKRIPLYCNIEIPEEITALEKLNIDGIGLFRTEFLYLDRKDMPDEEEQFHIYRQAAVKMVPRPVIIRTIDLGGDKIADKVCEKEANPNLGLRGIRLSFKHLELFKSQIKAILRAAVYGEIRIMFPMVINVQEIFRAKKIMEICKKELRSQNIEFKEVIPIGTMIEVPAAAIRAHEIAAVCDFLSIGTNDLVQYTLAVDRNNDLVAEYYNEIDPAVLFLIKNVCQSAHKLDKKVAVCGEMASQEKFTKLLIGLGVDELSTSPANYSEIKNTILKLDTNLCTEYADSLIK